MFSCKFCEILRTSLLQNTSGRPLLKLFFRSILSDILSRKRWSYQRRGSLSKLVTAKDFLVLHCWLDLNTILFYCADFYVYYNSLFEALYERLNYLSSGRSSFSLLYCGCKRQDKIVIVNRNRKLSWFSFKKLTDLRICLCT